MKGRTHQERKLEIATRFMEIVVNPPNNLAHKRRITVADLTRVLNMDRKTFYNYFDDISDMMVWIFRVYVKTMLESRDFAQWDLVYPEAASQDKYGDWPIYARNKINDSYMDENLFFKTLAYHWEDNREYYTKVFRDETYIDLYDYIIALYLPVFRDDVLIMLDGRKMPDIVIDFLAEYHVMGVFGRLRYHFARTGKFIMQDELGPFWNYSHRMLKLTVDTCFEKLPESKFSLFVGGGRKPRYAYKGLPDDADFISHFTNKQTN